jgi:hypothetical protein
VGGELLREGLRGLLLDLGQGLGLLGDVHGRDVTDNCEGDGADQSELHII